MPSSQHFEAIVSIGNIYYCTVALKCFSCYSQLSGSRDPYSTAMDCCIGLTNRYRPIYLSIFWLISSQKNIEVVPRVQYWCIVEPLWEPFWDLLSRSLWLVFPPSYKWFPHQRACRFAFTLCYLSSFIHWRLVPFAVIGRGRRRPCCGLLETSWPVKCRRVHIQIRS